MNKLIFIPEMFDDLFDHKLNLDIEQISSRAQAIFDDWIEKQHVVYGQRSSYDGEMIYSQKTRSRPTHTARIVCVEKFAEKEE